MSNEADHLSRTLVFTLNVILDSDAEKRQRIASAYQEAGLLVATIPLDKDGARPRVEACIIRFNRYKAAGDVACAGWILRAVEERVDERNLPGWRQLHKGIDQASKLLPLRPPSRH